MLGRGRRFRELVQRQLDLLAEDEAELLAEAEEADARWTHADRDESEELYGDYQLVVDAIGERLYDVRETYARTLDEDVRTAYRTTFDRAASERFPRYTAFLEDEHP